MKLSKLSALCFAATTLFAASSAMAWESEDGAWSTSANVTLGTDYIFRGASQTDDDAALSGGFDVGHSSGFYLGTWGSNVNFDINDDPAHLEVDIYGGFASEFGDSGVGYDVGVLRYIYPGTDGGDFNEFYAGLSYSYFNVGVAHSEDVYGSDEKATYYSAGFDYDLPYGVGFSTSIGYYDYDDLPADDGTDSATDWSIGLSKDFAGFSFGLTYTDLDSDGEDYYGVREDSNFVLSISKSL